ncbi:MAG: PepSY domain-containing protein [Candidatus Obscuribacterales bacterium]|nr:PepSY domain-containing protein [Steroidobacteraceae bacterium]
MTTIVSAAESPQSRNALPSAVTLQAGGMSLDQAVAMVQAKYSARVMRANTVEEEGRTVHYIRLITGDRARVFTVRIDAASGREF